MHGIAPLSLVLREQHQNVAAAHVFRDGGQNPRTRPGRSDPALQVYVESSVPSPFHLKSQMYGVTLPRDKTVNG